jgi:hypothetical protein
MKYPSEMAASPLRRQAADALRRARTLPVGPDRNDLRQLAIGLRFLEKQRLKTKAQDCMDASTQLKQSGNDTRS